MPGGVLMDKPFLVFQGFFVYEYGCGLYGGNANR